MDLKGQYAFEAPPATVWRRLMDPATIAGCLPGCERFEPAGEDRYQVVMTAGVAAISGRFEGSVAIADKQPESSYRLIVEGRGRPGFGSGEATVTLAPHDGGTGCVRRHAAARTRRRARPVRATTGAPQEGSLTCPPLPSQRLSPRVSGADAF